MRRKKMCNKSGIPGGSWAERPVSQKTFGPKSAAGPASIARTTNQNSTNENKTEQEQGKKYITTTEATEQLDF